MSLHIKYRPKTFNKVIGNKYTVRSLKSIIKEGKCHTHMFLFRGSSGCGKTTFARIIKEELNCSDMDYKEINAGNNRGIDTARDVLKNIHYAPIDGEVKVILFDEVHQTTKEFQNALLKAFEDTPQDTYFILCTTHPEKLLPTVRNRCASYEVESLDDDHIKKLLNSVVKKEGTSLLKVVRRRLIAKADGCPRLALVLLEQIIYMKGEDQLKAIRVFQTQEEKVIDLCRALIRKRKWIEITKILKGIDEEPETVRRAVLGYVNAVMLNKESIHCAVIFLAFKEPFFNSGKAGLTFACHRALS